MFKSGLLYVLGWKSENLTFWSFQAQKADFSGKKRTNLGAYFQKGLISDQGLIKHLAALQCNCEFVYRAQEHNGTIPHDQWCLSCSPNTTGCNYGTVSADWSVSWSCDDRNPCAQNMIFDLYLITPKNLYFPCRFNHEYILYEKILKYVFFLIVYPNSQTFKKYCQLALGHSTWLAYCWLDYC